LNDLQWGLNSYMLAFAALIVGRSRRMSLAVAVACLRASVCGGLAALWNRAHTFGLVVGGSYRVLLER
jgi:hypothetical protein